MSNRTVRLCFAGLAAIVAGHAAHALLGLGGPSIDAFFANRVYIAGMVGASLLCAARAATHHHERRPWAAMAAGLLLWSAGDLLATGWLGAPPTSPGAADALYLAYYPATYLGLVLLLRARLRHVSRGVWLDGIGGGLAVGALGIALVLPAVESASGDGSLAAAITIAYPLFDAVMLSTIVVAAGLNGWRLDRSWVLLGAGLLAMIAADGIYAYQDATGALAVGTILDTLWPLGAGLVAAAAWTPATRHRNDELMGSRATMVPVAFAMTAIGVLLYGQYVQVHGLAAILSAAALVVGGARAGVLFRENMRLLRSSREESLTDGLSGLPNRRALLRDLDDAFADRRPRTLALFDLDGFKQYNDTFGHAAGDELLRRLGLALAASIERHGVAYRLGGDEFCVLLDRVLADDDPIVLDAVHALVEDAGAFTVSSSHGVAALPREAATPADALKVADHRMYERKQARAGTGISHVREVLLAVLHEREPDLHRHMHHVAGLARAVGRELGVDAEDLDVIVRAAELHDVGKVAVPEAILAKPGPLDDEEWAFVKRHTLIGERIVGASPAMRPVGRVIRSSHERWDGAGYPDGLAGAAIPLGARIVLACDAFDAITSTRSYRVARPVEEALDELRAHAGSQFDPDVVTALVRVVAARQAAQAQPAEPAQLPAR